MKTDSLFYRLFQSDPSLALELAGIAVPEPERYRFGSHEIKQTAFRLDGVLEPPADQGDAPVAFAEVQFQPDDELYPRLVGEALLWLRQNHAHRPWHVVVIYPTQKVERLGSMAAPLLALPNLHRIYLDQLPLLDNPRLWLIALIVAKERDVPALAQRLRQHSPQDPAKNADWLDLLETLLVYKLPKLTREEIQAMLEFPNVDLKKTRFYQDVYAEGRTEGRNEGRAEGRSEGRTEGEAMLLLRLLERRFGQLSEETKRRIASADAETLLMWGERILDAKALDEIWRH